MVKEGKLFDMYIVDSTFIRKIIIHFTAIRCSLYNSVLDSSKEYIATDKFIPCLAPLITYDRPTPIYADSLIINTSDIEVIDDICVSVDIDADNNPSTDSSDNLDQTITMPIKSSVFTRKPIYHLEGVIFDGDQEKVLIPVISKENIIVVNANTNNENNNNNNSNNDNNNNDDDEEDNDKPLYSFDTRNTNLSAIKAFTCKDDINKGAIMRQNPTSYCHYDFIEKKIRYNTVDIITPIISSLKKPDFKKDHEKIISYYRTEAKSGNFYRYPTPIYKVPNIFNNQQITYISPDCIDVIKNLDLSESSTSSNLDETHDAINKIKKLGYPSFTKCSEVNLNIKPERNGSDKNYNSIEEDDTDTASSIGTMCSFPNFGYKHYNQVNNVFSITTIDKITNGKFEELTKSTWKQLITDVKTINGKYTTTYNQEYKNRIFRNYQTVKKAMYTREDIKICNRNLAKLEEIITYECSQYNTLRVDNLNLIQYAIFCYSRLYAIYEDLTNHYNAYIQSAASDMALFFNLVCEYRTKLGIKCVIKDRNNSIKECKYHIGSKFLTDEISHNLNIQKKALINLNCATMNYVQEPSDWVFMTIGVGHDCGIITSSTDVEERLHAQQISGMYYKAAMSVFNQIIKEHPALILGYISQVEIASRYTLPLYKSYSELLAHIHIMVIIEEGMREFFKKLYEEKYKEALNNLLKTDKMQEHLKRHTYNINDHQVCIKNVKDDITEIFNFINYTYDTSSEKYHTLISKLGSIPDAYYGLKASIGNIRTKRYGMFLNVAKYIKSIETTLKSKNLTDEEKKIFLYEYSKDAIPIKTIDDIETIKNRTIRMKFRNALENLDTSTLDALVEEKERNNLEVIPANRDKFKDYMLKLHKECLDKSLITYTNMITKYNVKSLTNSAKIKSATNKYYKELAQANEASNNEASNNEANNDADNSAIFSENDDLIFYSYYNGKSFDFFRATHEQCSEIYKRCYGNGKVNKKLKDRYYIDDPNREFEEKEYMEIYNNIIKETDYSDLIAIYTDKVTQDNILTTEPIPNVMVSAETYA